MPMIKRKDLKQKGKYSLKKHYLIFAAVCLISAFLASEFSGSLNFSTLRNYQEISAHPEEYTELSSVSKRGIGWNEVLEDVLTDHLEEGRQLSEDLQEQAVARSLEGNPMFGRTRGVLSSIINQFSSGSILVTFAAAVLRFKVLSALAPGIWSFFQKGYNISIFKICCRVSVRCFQNITAYPFLPAL